MRARSWPQLTRRQALVVGLALLGLVALAVAVGYTRAVAARQRPEANSLRAVGVIRAEKISIASEFGGLVAAMPAAAGERVAAGQLLVRLDSGLLDAQVEAGEALVAAAQAGLDLARAGSRPGRIAVAEAQLAQAQAGRAAAARAVADLEALVADPQDLGLQIAVGEAQLEAAQHRLAASVARKDAAERGMNDSAYYRDQLDALEQDPLDGLLPGKPPVSLPQPPGLQEIGDQASRGLDLSRRLLDLSYIPYWQGWIGVNAQAESIEGLEASLANLREQREYPQELIARRDEARAALAEAEAQAAAAQAQVEGLQAGASAAQLAALEARLAQAEAALEALRTQRSMREIVAPAGGVILELIIGPGEVAAPGAALLTLADTRDLSLTVYVPENQVGQVKLGQEVQVTVDSFPGRTFAGRVRHIADRAEFTPRNVSTKEERVNLVFAVEIQIANEDGALKPGMPADVAFE